MIIIKREDEAKVNFDIACYLTFMPKGSPRLYYGKKMMVVVVLWHIITN